MSTTISADRRWFREHPEENIRIRLPAPGEVEALMVRAYPALALDVAAHGGSQPSPDGYRWAVAVIAVDRTTILRALVAKEASWNGEPLDPSGWSGALAIFGHRAIIEKGV